MLALASRLESLAACDLSTSLPAYLVGNIEELLGEELQFYQAASFQLLARESSALYSSLFSRLAAARLRLTASYVARRGFSGAGRD